MDKIFSVETFDKYKKEIAHSPFRVFTAKELEEDPLVNYIDDYISNNQEGFNDEKSMQEDQFSLSENDEKHAQIQMP